MVQLEADANETYAVELYNSETKAWESVDFDQLCYNSTMDTPTAKSYTSCELYVASTVPAQNFSYLKVTKTKTGTPKPIEEVE